MLPEFLLAMGLAFDPATGAPEISDDPTAESAPDWTVLIPENRHAQVANLIKTTRLPDLDEYATVTRGETRGDSITVLLLDLMDPGTETTSVFAASYTPSGLCCDIRLLGTRGSETITPFLDVRDNHGESVAFIARERPVSISFETTPEGTSGIRTIEITEVDVWNAENSDTETYRLTELHRTYVVDPDGTIRLTESRPVPTDRDAFTARFRVTYP